MTKICIECSKEFEPKAHNQKYCTPECCRIATNKKIMANYYAKKSRMAGEKRNCAECGAPLSRYNEGIICGLCEIEDENDQVNKIIGGIVNNASKRGKKSKAK